MNLFKLRGIKPADTTFFYGRYIGARSIILPHVSKTGAVPIRIFNEGYGFSVTPTLLRSIDWLGVGTNEKLNFDYERGKTSSISWYHDYEHTARSGRFGSATDMDPRTENIGRLRAQMKLMPPGESSNQEELAFFYTFHESQVEQEKITSYLGRVIANRSQQLEEGLTLEGSGFSSPEQFETNIAAAKSLGLAVEGETLLERQAAFLKHLIAGYKTLQSLAHYHDVEG